MRLRWPAAVVLSFALLLCSGCTMAIVSPTVYAELPSEFDFDPTLIGAWEEDDGTQITIVPREDGGYVLSAIAPVRSGDDGASLDELVEQPAVHEWSFALVPLAEWYLVVPLGDDDIDEAATDEPYTCLAILLQCSRNEMQFCFLNPFQFTALAEEENLQYDERTNHVRCRHLGGNEMAPTNAIYLTGDNKEVADFLLRHRNDEALFLPMMTLRRADS